MRGRVSSGARADGGHCRALAACAALALALAGAACRAQDAPRAKDAAVAIDAAAPDAPVVDAAPPIDAAATPAPTRLVAAGDTTCAVLSDATVRCWGGNAHGQLGNDDTADAATPVAPKIHAVVDLQLAGATACALLDDASVACWGQIAWRGHGEDVLHPAGVLGVIGVKRIFVLPGRACARVANDSLVCWGDVDARGHFAAGAAHRQPTPVVGLDHVAGLTVSGAFADDGRIWRWGSDGVPHRLDATGIQEIAARDGIVCGRADGGRVVCADTGKCGPAAAAPAGGAAGAAASSSTPPSKPAASTPAAKPGKSSKSGKPGKPSKAGAKSAKLVGAAAAGAATAAGPAPSGEPVLVPGFTPARQLAFDVGFCVVNTFGRLQCGDGCHKFDPISLERVDTLAGRCAVLKSGTITCFDGAKFVAVSGLQHASLIAAGRAHACAVTGGRLVCWGDNTHSQLGEFAATQ